jgi:hypothetical protein
MFMLWEEYYDKLGDWATSTAVSRMSKLESFGPPDEIIDAINTIGFDDKKGATRLLKKAIAAGVKFTGDQLSGLYLICDEEVINHAIQTSSPHFKTEDLDALYGFRDEEVLIDIAKKQKIRIPESLADYAEVLEANSEEAIAPPITPEEFAAEYDYILNCLQKAHGLLKKAYQFSLIDTNRRKRAATVVKYACIADAQSYIATALDSWNALDIPSQNKQPLRGIWPNIRNSTMWQNYLFEGFFTNIMVKREIRKVIKNIEAAYHMIRKLRNAL